MARDLHSVAVVDGSTLAREDRIVVAMLPQVAHSAGGGAGQVVSFAVTGLQLPATYGVQATADQDATVWISARSSAGFTVNVEPRLAANTLAAGHIDLLVVA